MKSKKILGVSAAIALAAAFGNAQAREFADIYTECGLGAMIAPNNSAVAAVTNVTWDLGTTAISSNISSPETCKGGEERTAMLIFEAYPALERQLAEGEGTHLAALFDVAGVAADKRDESLAAIRTGLAGMVAAEDYARLSRVEKAERLYEIVQTATAS